MKHAEVIRRVRDEARHRGVRWTNQRQIIVDAFITSDDHLTVEELHRRVREIDRTVSAATVYRTVNMLVDLGVAHKGNFGTGSANFECSLNKEHHDHLVCMSCGSILEFHHDRIESLQEEIAQGHGFALHHHRMELYGVCAACQKKAAPGSKPAPTATIG